MLAESSSFDSFIKGGLVRTMSVGAFTGAATVGSGEDDDATIAGAFCPGFDLVPPFAAFLNVVMLGPFISPYSSSESCNCINHPQRFG